MSAAGVLLPYQQRWVGDKSPVKISEKSRRIGITWAEAADDTLLAASEDGMDVWYVGYNKDMALEFIQTCARWAKIFNYTVSAIDIEEIVEEDKKILAFSVKFESGFRVTALSSRPSNLRGKQGKVVIDEAAFHDNLPELLKAAMALLIWGGRVVIISTHNGEDNPFNDLIKDVRAGRLPYSIHTTTFDAAIADGLYEQIAQVSKGKITPKEQWIGDIYAFYGDTADEELRCIPSRSGGAYFSQALLEGVMEADIKVLQFISPGEGFVDWPKEAREAYTLSWCKEHLKPELDKCQGGLQHFTGFDVGRDGDLSVVWPLEETQALELETPFVVEMVLIPFSEQRAVMMYLHDNLPRFCGCAVDATGIGRQIAEEMRQEYGASRVLEQKLSEGYYAEAMPKAKSRMEDRSVTIPKDAGVLSDFRMIKVVGGTPKPSAQKNKVGGIQRHGDSAGAFVLSVWAREKLSEFGEPEYESLARRDMNFNNTAY